ncbi:MAG: CPBP family intramembrane glutamic endopeptidase [Bacteroidota bacterium]
MRLRLIWKEYNVIFLTMGVFLVLLSLESPIKRGISLDSQNRFAYDLIAGIIIRLAILLFALIIIYKKGLRQINGIGKQLQIDNIHSFIIVSVVITLMLLSNFQLYKDVPLYIFGLFLSFTLSVGFAEEFILRGIIQPLLIRNFLMNKNSIFIGVIITSIVFGFFHFLNLKKEPDNLIGISHQVLFASCVGLFFGGLLIRTKNIIPVAFIHGLINLSFGPGKLKEYLKMNDFQNLDDKYQILSLIITSVICLLIGFSGIFMINISNKEEYLSKIEKLNI